MRPHLKRPTVRSRGSQAPPLEAIERFVRLIARTGLTRGELRAALVRGCDAVPEERFREQRKKGRGLLEASHVLTLWISDPKYVDEQGEPLALPASGREPCLEALVQRVDPRLKTSEVIQHLIERGAVRREHGRYVLERQWVRYRGYGGAVDLRYLHPLLGMLRALEHNAEVKDESRCWFEAVAENPRFPVSARAALESKLYSQAMDILHGWDAEMHRAELARDPKEPTVRMAIGIYQFEAEPEEAGHIAERSPDAPPPPRARQPKGRRS